MQVQRLFHVYRLCPRRLLHRRSLAVQSRDVLQFRCLTSVAESSPSPSASIPPPMEGSYPEKIKKIVEDISQLTLLETSQLNDLLKTTLNIPDAPVMAMGGMPTATPVAKEPEEAEEAQTAFTVNLTNYADDSKIKLIKEVKAQTEGMNLVQAKKFVESLPHEVKGGVSKEEANKIAAALEAVGGVVEIV